MRMCVQTRAEVSVHYRQAMKHFRSLHQLSFEGSANLDLFILLYTEVWGTMGYRGTSLPLSPLPLPPSPPSLPPSLRLCVNRNSRIMEFEMSLLCTWLPYVYRDIWGAACTVFSGYKSHRIISRTPNLELVKRPDYKSSHSN